MECRTLDSGSGKTAKRGFDRPDKIRLHRLGGIQDIVCQRRFQNASRLNDFKALLKGGAFRVRNGVILFPMQFDRLEIFQVGAFEQTRGRQTGARGGKAETELRVIIAQADDILNGFRIRHFEVSPE
ncbi:hypothetical protein SDC9_156603 [bioreactor metagenome]|uniref:Uncharacterized protein n=1 Tax=bioreactor metagenome TaxID=1076179 RepID=A0A645F9R9_9ZZZZ